MACREHVIKLPIMYAKAYICDTKEDMPKEISEEELEKFHNTIYCYVGNLEEEKEVSLYVWEKDKQWIFLSFVSNQISKIVG